MYIKIFIFLVSGLLFSSNSSIEEGIDYYNKRADVLDGIIPSQDNIEKAISIFESHLDTDSDKVAGIYLVKSYYYMAQYISQDEDVKVMYFELAMTMAKQYISKYPDSVDYLYWYLATMSNWAKNVGLWAITKMGGGEEFREKAVDVIVLDHEYENGGGYFLLGAVYFTAPRIPLISTWPNNSKAIKYFKKAVETGLATPLQQIYLARALLKEDMVEDCREVLNEIIALTPNPSNLVEDMTYISEAETLLNEISK